MAGNGSNPEALMKVGVDLAGTTGDEAAEAILAYVTRIVGNLMQDKTTLEDPKVYVAVFLEEWHKANPQ